MPPNSFGGPVPGLIPASNTDHAGVVSTKRRLSESSDVVEVSIKPSKVIKENAQTPKPAAKRKKRRNASSSVKTKAESESDSDSSITVGAQAQSRANNRWSAEETTQLLEAILGVQSTYWEVFKTNPTRIYKKVTSFGCLYILNQSSDRPERVQQHP